MFTKQPLLPDPNMNDNVQFRRDLIRQLRVALTDIYMDLQGLSGVDIPPGSEMTNNHSELDELDYASAGHTGFEPTVTKGDLTTTAPLSSTATRKVIGGAQAISIPKAATAADGYLSKEDWNTFNGKEPALTKGALTAVSPLSLSAACRVIDAAAALSIDLSGYIAGTSGWIVPLYLLAFDSGTGYNAVWPCASNPPAVNPDFAVNDNGTDETELDPTPDSVTYDLLLPGAFNIKTIKVRGSETDGGAKDDIHIHLYIWDVSATTPFGGSWLQVYGGTLTADTWTDCDVSSGVGTKITTRIRLEYVRTSVAHWGLIKGILVKGNIPVGVA